MSMIKTKHADTYAFPPNKDNSALGGRYDASASLGTGWLIKNLLTTVPTMCRPGRRAVGGMSNEIAISKLRALQGDTR